LSYIIIIINHITKHGCRERKLVYMSVPLIHPTYKLDPSPRGLLLVHLK
jgi:hypothetical protein